VSKTTTSLFSLVVAIALAGCASDSKTVVDQSQRTQAANFNLQLGSDYFRQGNLPAAKEKLERALEQDPRNAQTHMVLGLLHQRLGENDKADTYFSRAVSLDKDNSELRNSYAAFLCSIGKYERGEKLALESAADQLYRTPAASYMNAGYCARGEGDLKRAEQHFRQALKVQPNFAPALLELAELQLKQNQPLVGRAFLERYASAASPSASSLWLGVRIERALTNYSLAGDYARRLRNEFPTSDEARQLRELEKQISTPPQTPAPKTSTPPPRTPPPTRASPAR
jgi:type IV pilus assembly protein PilF